MLKSRPTVCVPSGQSQLTRRNLFNFVYRGFDSRVVSPLSADKSRWSQHHSPIATTMRKRKSQGNIALPAQLWTQKTMEPRNYRRPVQNRFLFAAVIGRRTPLYGKLASKCTDERKFSSWISHFCKQTGELYVKWVVTVDRAAVVQ